MESPFLEQTASGPPRSARFDDIYFSRTDGLEETRYVFLRHNRLRERFAALPRDGVFTIAETGFGTGLNFLAAWQLFLECAPAGARLLFVSTEKYPLSREQIRACLAAWPELSPLVDKLVAHYPALYEGFHAIEPDARIDLLLLLGDANDTLADLNARVDAWFLDGFAPARNPDLWQAPLFDAMARMSHGGTTAATFTAARRVRDGLAGAGFEVRRAPGYGRKRDMLAAHCIGRHGPPPPGLWPRNEWHWPRPAGPRRAIVVGAGLAGAHTAWELARRGWSVTVLEQADAPAAGASGNTQGAVYARLSHELAVANRFQAQALELSQQRLARLPESVPHARCGLLQLNQGTKEARRFDRFAGGHPFPADFVEPVTGATASRLAGVTLDAEALYFPGGGWVNPAALAGHRLDHPNIRVCLGHRVTDLARTHGEWRVTAETGQDTTVLTAPQVILTTAWQSAGLTPAAYLPVRPIAGQVTRIASRPPLSGLKTVLCSDRYLVPSWQGAHSLGATFHLKQDHARERPEDDADNLRALHQRLPDLVSESDTVVDARGGVRCASPDYLPLVGPLLDADAFRRDYARPLQKRLTRRLPPPPFHAGLWVNIAHGSKGLCTIPLAAKALAAWLNHEPLTVPQSIANHLNPNRFLIRAMIRGTP